MIVERKIRTGTEQNLLPNPPFALFEGQMPTDLMIALEGWNGMSGLNWRVLVEEVSEEVRLSSEP